MLIKTAQRKSGEFTNDQNQKVAYDNLYFTVDTGDKENCLFGSKYEIIKVSVKDFNKYYQQPVNTLEGKDVIFAFDQNKHLIGIYNVK